MYVCSNPLTRLNALVLGVMFLAALTLTGCGDGDVSGPEPTPLDRESPDNLLNFYIHAHEDQDIGLYEESLHDDFMFVFNPEVAESLGLPPGQVWWGKTESVNATLNMFNDTTITAIEMSLPKAIGWYPCQEVREDTTFSGLCSRLSPEIKVTIEEPGDEPWIFLIQNSWFDMMVVPDPFTKDLWVILRIEETPKPVYHMMRGDKGNAYTHPTAWGQIKAEFGE